MLITAQTLKIRQVALQAQENATTVAFLKLDSGSGVRPRSGCVTAADNFGGKTGILGQKSFGTAQLSADVQENGEEIAHLRTKRRSQSQQKELGKHLQVS